MTGRKIDHFDVLEKLGEGGMGAVYKARDTHLDRFVALKVLRQDRVADPERRRRFINEAKTASSLNHPNIVTIYDIAQGDGVDYIAMEMIRGRTLDSVIAGRGLSVGDTLKYAIQVASAMTAAHGAGVIHRDLKPANVMVTEQGLVKVLDFGLAKLTETVPLDPGAATETLARAETEGGAILGTVAYMSPEQAEGKTVDARSDIFSFGVVLYEMLTGRRAFQRESKVSTLAAILHQEAAPLNPAAAVPHEFERIVARCLRKDPERRFQSMKEVGIALEELKEESESGRESTTAVAAPAKRRRPVGWIAVAAAVLAAGAGLGWWLLRRESVRAPLRLQALTADSGLTTTPAISPDARMVAYASDRATGGNLDIWVHPLAAGAQPIRLTRHEADDMNPSFSPDGGMIAFFSRRDGGGIYIVPTLGGAQERLLVRGGHNPRFSPGGKWVAYSVGKTLSDSRVFVIPAAGGPPRQIAPEIRWAAGPVWSPDGKRILMAGSNSASAVIPDDMWLADVEGGPAVATNIGQHLASEGLSLSQVRSAEWIGDSLVYSLSGAGTGLWQVGFSGATGRVTGRARRITQGTSLEFGVRGNPAGRSGMTLVLVSGAAANHLWKLPLDTKLGTTRAPMEALSHGGGDQTLPAASQDGRKLVYRQQSPAGFEVRLRELASNQETTLVTGNYRPRLSPDGGKVAYSDYSPRRAGIFLMDAGGGEPVPLLSPKGFNSVYGWSPDGRAVVYYDGSPIRFFLLDAATRTPRELLGHPSKNIHAVEFSPDQRWVAFQVPSGSRATLYVVAVRDGRGGPESEWIEIAGGAPEHSRPWWSPDGNLLYFTSNMDGSRCVWAQKLNPAAKRSVGEPFAVHHFHHARLSTDRGGGGLANFGPAVLPDGIIFSLNELTGNIWLATAGE